MTRPLPNKTILRVLLAAAVVLLFCGAAVGAVAGGDGSSADSPIEIPDADSLTKFLNNTTTGQYGKITTDTITVSNEIAVTGAASKNLDLNGKTITAGDAFSDGLIKWNSSGKLTITDSTGGKLDGAGKTRVLYIAAGEVELVKGTITGGNSTKGGGVYVNSGKFTMSGGSITGNSATGIESTDGGGGVCVWSGGTFMMSGGTISKNTARNGSWTGKGGGVCSYSKFTMSGGTIGGENNADENLADYGGGVYVSGDYGLFTMSNSASIKGNTATTNGGGVYVNYGTFAMSGSASITENTANGNGGGVYVYRSDTFAMSGSASITENTAWKDGGGVYVEGLSAKSSKFTMSDAASITKNTAQTGNGGGVYVNYGTFTMERGTIAGNTATKDGGGVYVESKRFTMTGGSITGNSANYGDGGGVYVGSDGTFEMSGGTIGGADTGKGNTAKNNGGGVYVNAGKFNVSGAPVIKGNTNKEATSAASNVYLSSADILKLTSPLAWEKVGGVVTPLAEIRITSAGSTPAENSPFGTANASFAGAGLITNDEQTLRGYIDANDSNKLKWGKTEPEVPLFVAEIGNTEYTSVAAAISKANAGDTITMIADSIEGTVIVGKKITLNLNGKTLKNGGGGSVIEIRSGGNLTLTDTGGGGCITGCNDSTSDGGGVYVGSGGTFTMKGGSITKNTAGYGSGVYVRTGGTFIMEGGSITENTASYDGGGVCVWGGTFTMSGGSITKNTAKDDYWTREGGGVYIRSGGTFTMTGGSITKNTATTNGGGVCVGFGGTFTMKGGSITKNTAKYGGGVYVMDEATNFEVSGTPVIKDNTEESGAPANNVYLSEGKFITVTGAITGEIYVNNPEPESNKKFGTAAQEYAGADHFISDAVDDSGKHYVGVWGTKSGETYPLNWESAAEAYPITISDSIRNGTVTSSPSAAKAGAEITLTATPDKGYVFESWDVNAESAGKITVTANKFTMPNPAEEVTVSATFKSKPIPTTATVTFNVLGHGTAPASQTIEIGGKVIEPSPAPSETSWTFGGWYKEPDCINAWNFDAGVTESMTLYAKWTSWTVDPIGDQSWTGSPITPEVTVHDGDKILIKDRDYTVKYSDNTDPGTATVTVTGIGAYSGTQTVHFAIKKSIETSTIAKIPDQAYTGSPITPNVTVRDGDTVLVKGLHYKVSYENNVDMGTARVIVEGINCYFGTLEETFEIVDPASGNNVTFEYQSTTGFPCDALPEQWVVQFNTEVSLPTKDEIEFAGYTFKGWRSADLTDEDWIDTDHYKFRMPNKPVHLIADWERKPYFDERVYIDKGTNIVYIYGGLDDNKNGVKAYVYAADNIDENSSPSYLAAYDTQYVPEPSASSGYTDFLPLAKFNIKAEMKDSQKSPMVNIYVGSKDKDLLQNIYLLQYNSFANGGGWSAPIKPNEGYPKHYTGDVYEYMFTIDHYNTPFALVYEKPVKKSSSSSSQGSSYWATETPTPTPTATATPTPVETPSVKPVATETQTPAKSPMPLAGLLAGLGAAAAVAAGLRRR